MTDVQLYKGLVIHCVAMVCVGLGCGCGMCGLGKLAGLEGLGLVIWDLCSFVG